MYKRNSVEKIYDEIQQEYGVTRDVIRAKVESLRIWIDQQAHFPKQYNDKLIEGCLLRNRFSVEQTKTGLENYFSLKSVHRKYYHPSNANFEPSIEAFWCVPMSDVSPRNDRIIYCRLDNRDPNVFDMDRIISQAVLMFEYLMMNDYTPRLMFVMDCSGFTLDHVKKINFSHVFDCLELIQKVYSFELSGIRYFNAPPFWSIIMEMIKAILPLKLFENVKMMRTIDGLFDENLPRKCLPCECGGELIPVQEILEEWNEMFKENIQEFDKNYSAMSDVSKRGVSSNGRKLNREVEVGCEGSYVKLSS